MYGSKALDLESNVAVTDDDLIAKSYQHNVELATTYAPVKPRRYSNTWIRSRTRKWMVLRNKAWADYRELRDESSRSEYTRHRNYCNDLVRQDKRQWQCSLANKFKNNPKSLYRHINKLRKVQHGIPALLCDGGLTTSMTEAAEALLKQFTPSQLVTLPAPTDTKLHRVHITPEMVHKKLQSLRRHVAPGNDNIGSNLLIPLSNVLAVPLAGFFQMLHDCAAIPEAWKLGLITPIHKEWSLPDPANYRPITLLPILLKVMQ